MANEKKDGIRIALEHLMEAAGVLAVHGSEGYSTESGALDEVFRRSLVNLKRTLEESGNTEFYDPYGRITESLSDYI